ncbi:MAG: hypothetical protein WDL87_02745 [Candidatus Omnitrophota bacterium]|jgi:hypothetical protein
MEFLNLLRQEAFEWCKGRSWLIRLPLLVWFAYCLARYLMNPLYHSVFDLLNLGIHELGHMIFAFLGEFIGVWGGTLAQCLVPVFAVFNFYRQKDFFAISLSFGWLAINLFGVATYLGDARAMDLPLVSPFGSDNPIIHDWNYLLTRLGVLRFDAVFAGGLRIIAVMVMLVCLGSGAWLLWQMYNNPQERRFNRG